VSAQRVVLWALTNPAAALAAAEALIGFGIQIGEEGWGTFWDRLRDPKDRWFVLMQVLMDYMHVRNSMAGHGEPPQGRRGSSAPDGSASPLPRGSGENPDLPGARQQGQRLRSVIQGVHDGAANTHDGDHAPGGAQEPTPRPKVSSAAAVTDAEPDKRTRAVHVGHGSDHGSDTDGEHLAGPPLSRAQRAQLIRSKDLPATADGRQIVQKQDDAALVVGRKLKTEADGGDTSALEDIGVRNLPKDYAPGGREFTLLETRDGFVVTIGGPRRVVLPHGTRLCGHTHPRTMANDGVETPLHLRDEKGTTASVTFDEIAKDQNSSGANRSGLLPSAADIDALHR
jgi:hypothetical protein